MYISLLSLAAIAIKRFWKQAAAFLEQAVHSKHAIIAHYATRRWCDSTERALNEELMGRGSWLGNRFGSENISTGKLE
jgi:hypothetical protein